MKRGKSRKVKHLKKSHINWIIVYTIIISLVGFTALPLVYMVVTAFKPLDELFIYPPRFFVAKPTLKNFADLLGGLSSSTVPFARYIFNSIFVSGTIVAATVIVSCMGAYGMVKHRIPFGKTLFSIIIAALMFSPHVTQIPTYLVVNKLGILDTYWALIIPRVAVAYNFFLIKQFIDQFPNDLLESARIDGAKEIKVFFQVLMPNIKPAWCTLIVLSFVLNWNDYFSSLIYTSRQSMKVLTLALQVIGGTSIARQGAVAAATFLMTAPTVIVYLFMQKNVLNTMVHSGIKA